MPPAKAADVGLIPRLGRSPGEGNGNLLQYSCLGNPMDRGAWQTTVHGVTKESDMTEWLSTAPNTVLSKCKMDDWMERWRGGWTDGWMDGWVKETLQSGRSKLI